MADVRYTETRSTEARGASRPLAELVADLGRGVSALVSKESSLLRSEVDEKYSNMQTAGGTIAAGAVCLLAALLILLQAVVVALTNLGMNPGWASLIVGVCVGVIGIILLQVGRSSLGEGFFPKRTQAQVQRDAEMLKEQVK